MNKTLMVEYDLIKTKDYTRLIQEIEKLTPTKLLSSSWLINTNLTPFEVANHLENFIDSDDKLAVFEVNMNNGATSNFIIKWNFEDNVRENK